MCPQQDIRKSGHCVFNEYLYLRLKEIFLNAVRLACKTNENDL